MIPIAKLKQNLDFNKDFGDLIEVMKLAATLQFGQFRSAQEPFKEFSASLEAVLSDLLSFGQKLTHIFLEARTGLPAGIIVLSSDEGFLGELNTLLFDRFLQIRKNEDKVFVLGQQGANYLDEMSVNYTQILLPSEKLEFGRVESLRDMIVEAYIKGEIGKAYIIYPQFVSITFQQVEAEVLLPLPSASVFETSPAAPARAKIARGEFIIEPNINSVLDGWIKLWLSSRLFQIFWSAKLAEFAARIMHLEASIQELKRINHNLKLEYFKYLHGLSDKTIREIYASRLVEAR